MINNVFLTYGSPSSPPLSISLSLSGSLSLSLSLHLSLSPWLFVIFSSPSKALYTSFFFVFSAWDLVYLIF